MYVILVIFPMFLLGGYIATVNSPVLDTIDGGFIQLDRQFEDATLLPILSDLQKEYADNPQILLDAGYLKAFSEKHEKLMTLTVSVGERTIFSKNKYDEQSSLNHKKGKSDNFNFPVNNQMVKVDLNYMPMNLIINGNDIRSIFERRFKWSVISYLIFSSMFIIWILKFFLKPFNQLRVVAQKVGRKEYDFQLDTARKDEIGDTFKAFDLMGRSVQSYEQSRKELITNISHDLKTPITALKGYITAIQDGLAKSPEKMDKYLTIMNKNVTPLDQLVDDLFLHAKLDVDQVSFDLKPIVFGKYMEYLVDDIRMELESQEVQIHWNDNDLDDSVCMIDSFKMRLAIHNLVENAVKHFDKPTKHLSLQLIAHKDNHEIELIIADNGKGIASSDLESVFERFYRTDSSRNTNIGGTGLGLAICQQIMDKHCGRIFATSKINCYTAIHIILPIQS
jgi:signal transduction histidine kinase